MDARDIQAEPPVIEDGRYLEKIYELQMDLINEYVKIEGNVAPPININTKRSQVLLKDFTGRVIEELAEGYESLIQIDELMQKNQLFRGANWNEKDLRQVINHLQNAGEEMADAMHFFVELLIYINIQPEDIDAWVNSKLPTSESLLEQNTIAKCMIRGNADIREEYGECDHRNIVDLIDLYAFDSISNHRDPMEVKLLAGGSRYNQPLYKSFKSMLWDVTYHLNIARNYLKNKPWKQSQMMTNEEGYQEEVVKAFVAMMGVFYEMGLNDESLFYLYFKKNMVNRFRQKSNY